MFKEFLHVVEMTSLAAIGLGLIVALCMVICKLLERFGVFLFGESAWNPEDYED